MLCAVCDKIILDYDLLVDDEISISHKRSDTYPGLPSISLAAKNGCEFCRLLRDAINTKLDLISDFGDRSTEMIEVDRTKFLLDQAVDSDSVAELVMQLSGPSLDSALLRFAISAEEGHVA